MSLSLGIPLDDDPLATLAQLVKQKNQVMTTLAPKQVKLINLIFEQDFTYGLETDIYLLDKNWF